MLRYKELLFKYLLYSIKQKYILLLFVNILTTEKYVHSNMKYAASTLMDIAVECSSS